MGSFVSSNVSICGILNFAGRGKCKTPTVNGDSICCTRASIQTRARPFTASFIWLSSNLMSLNLCSPMIAPLCPADKGLAHCLYHSHQAFLHYDPLLQGECRDHAPFLGLFLLLHRFLEEGRGVAIFRGEWCYALLEPVVPHGGVAFVW